MHAATLALYYTAKIESYFIGPTDCEMYDSKNRKSYVIHTYCIKYGSFLVATN